MTTYTELAALMFFAVGSPSLLLLTGWIINKLESKK